MDETRIGFVFLDAQHSGGRLYHLGAVGIAAELVARAGQFAHQLGEAVLADLRRDGGEGCGEIFVRAVAGMAQQAVLRFVQQLALSALIGDGEMRRDASFERKAP